MTESQNTSGPAGSYGCVCVSRDARNCALFRYGYKAYADSFDERCECLCHNWPDDDDEDIAPGAPKGEAL